MGDAPNDPKKRLAVLLAGSLAEQLAEGAPGLATSDFQRAAALLSSLPAYDRARVRHEAIDLAMRALKTRWDFVEALAKELQQKGSFP
jgi:hypothetical protein